MPRYRLVQRENSLGNERIFVQCLSDGDFTTVVMAMPVEHLAAFTNAVAEFHLRRKEGVSSQVNGD